MPIARSRLETLQIRKLIQYVRQQDAIQITKMIELGVPGLINYQDPDTGSSPLHVAVTLNLENIVTHLLELQASTAVRDLEGCTAVMRACQYGHLQSLESLAMKGLSLHVTDNEGCPALFHCLHPTTRHAKCVTFLLESEASPNTKNTSGRTILCAACEGGFDKIVERLLDKGADPNAKDPGSGKPAVVLAAEGGHVECLKLLAISGADLNATYSTNISAIHRAGELGHFEIIQTLSAYGADFSRVTSANETAVHYATVAYRLLCIRMLGQRGCPTNETNQDGLTPQKIAKNEGMKDAMKELKKLTNFQDKVARGGKAKGYSEPWCVRLYDWLQINKKTVVPLLKSHEDNRDCVMPTESFTRALNNIGVPLTAEDWPKLLKVYDKKGEGSLNWDDLLTDHKYVNVQYKLGPNDDIKAKKGKKKKGGKKGGKKGKGKIIFPIYFEADKPPVGGVSAGMVEKEQLLTDNQRFSRDTPLPHSYVDDSIWYLVPPERQYIQLYEAIRHGDMEAIEGALHQGISVDERDKYNKTPLMIACAHGRMDVVKYLLENGADVNAYDNFMWTALHHACHAGEEEIVRLLLDHDADVDVQSYNGGTALMRAIETSQRNMVKLLIERGAKLTLVNKHGDTPLDVARNWGDEFIYAIVYAQASGLPPPPEAKGDKKAKGKEKGGKKAKKGGKGGKGGEASKASVPGPPIEPLPLPAHLPSPMEHLQHARQKYSFQALHSDISVKPAPNYRPTPAWIQRPLTTQAYHNKQDQSREERGIDATDFEETKTPFQMQIIARTEAIDL